jgi:GT2 family glycosyltransferase
MVNRVNGLTVNEQHWASCSFMIIQVALYRQLNGLEESFYMYCEDIDFCRRASLVGHQISYLSSIKAVHYRRCSSKRFLSKYFFWHVSSVFKYSFTKKKIQAKKSSLIIESK